MMRNLIVPLAVAVASMLATPLQAQAQHHNDLSWAKSSATYTVGYNVYRANGNCASTTACTFTKLQGSISALSYSDTSSALTAGSVHTYYVTAYDVTAANSESVPSNLWVGTTPPDGGTGGGQTPPPSGLTGSSN